MKTIILLSAVFILSGCSLFQEQTQYIDRPVPSDFALTPATQVDPIESKEVVFNVISRKDFTKAAMEKYGLDINQAAELAETVYEDDIALMTLSLKAYENLGENMQEIIRYIRDQRAVIQYYKNNVPEPKQVDPKTDAKEG